MHTITTANVKPTIVTKHKINMMKSTDDSDDDDDQSRTTKASRSSAEEHFRSKHAAPEKSLMQRDLVVSKYSQGSINTNTKLKKAPMPMTFAEQTRLATLRAMQQAATSSATATGQWVTARDATKNMKPPFQGVTKPPRMLDRMGLDTSGKQIVHSEGSDPVSLRQAILSTTSQKQKRTATTAERIREVTLAAMQQQHERSTVIPRGRDQSAGCAQHHEARSTPQGW